MGGTKTGRELLRRLLALAVAGVVVLGACGNDDADPASEASTTTTAGDDGSASGGDGGTGDLPPAAAFGGGDCAAVALSFAQALAGPAQALTGGPADFGPVIQGLTDVQDVAPGELAGPIGVIVEALEEFGELTEDLDIDPQNPDPEAFEAFAQAAEQLFDEEYEAAAEQVEAWFDENCPQFTDEG